MKDLISNVSLMVALRGVAAITFGVLALVWPGITLSALLIVLGAFVFVDGVTAIGLAITGQSTMPRWVLLLDGIAGVVFAGVTLVAPGVTALALLYMIAVWCLFTGSLLIGGAVSGETFERPGWLMALDGVISVVFGVLLIAWPGDGILALVWALGLYAIFAGVTMLFGAFLFADRSATMPPAGAARPAAAG
ncbi:MAG: DUF308 domain-containing protein [Dehalococcoidia bacterium]